MKLICELNDKIILGKDGRSDKAPRLTARAIVKNGYGMYAVMHSLKFGLYSLPGGGVEDNEDVVTALRREIMEETGCTCDNVEELGIVYENRASLDYTQINHYFAIYTEHIGQTHLTENELKNKTWLEWHTWDETVSLINGQEIEKVQQKYLKARDVAALEEYARVAERIRVIQLDDKLRLNRFDGNYDFAFEWYQDTETVLLVDGKAEPYSYETLTNMYNYLNQKGELYFIEVNENGKWNPVGDVTFWQEDMPIVIGERKYRRKGIGKKVVSALVERGKAMGYDKLYVGEIYDFNIGSQKCFESVGFRSYEKTEKGSRYVLELKK